MLPSARLTFTAALAALAALPAFAQPSTSSPHAIELDPFPVVGTRLNAPSHRVSPNVIILDEAFIERSGAIDLAGLINLLPQTYGGAASDQGTVPNGSQTYGAAKSLFNFTTGAAVSLGQTGV